jgi:hypothetical protein
VIGRLYSDGPSHVGAAIGLFGCQHCLRGLHEQVQKAHRSQLEVENEMRVGLFFIIYFD